MKKIVALLLASTSIAYGQQPDVKICEGEYALCAASTCTPTGGTITVKGVAYKEVSCKCPVLKGPSIADLNGGNMKGSCAATEPNQVWSTFSLRKKFPQEMAGWKYAPAKFQTCTTGSFSQCWSFSCTKIGTQNGTTIADCRCPMNENINGTPTPPNTKFSTEAGYGDPSYCAQYPVGGPMP